MRHGLGVHAFAVCPPPAPTCCSGARWSEVLLRPEPPLSAGPDGRPIEQDGARYDGQWQHGMMHGFGLYVLDDGRWYEGMWADDEMEGYGVEKLSPEAVRARKSLAQAFLYTASFLSADRNPSFSPPAAPPATV